VKVALLALCAGVLPVSAQALDQHYRLNIPREPLDAALKDFARQTSLQIARFTDTVSGSALVGPVTGELSAEQALKFLLAPSGLTYKIVNDRTVAVISATEGGGPVQPHGRDRTPEKLAAGDATHRESLLKDETSRVAKDSTARSSHSRRVSAALDQSAEDDRDTARQYEEVVVTAQKRAERLADVPSSISVVTARQAQKYALTSLVDYANYVPGFYVQGGDAIGSARIILRGINDDGSASPLVATYVDNFPVGASTGATRSSMFPVDLLPYDLERIEVLRGPQGTLYGASAMGGLLKYVMRAPDLTEFQLRSGVEMEALDHSSGLGRTVRAALSGPIVDNRLGVRLSAFDRRSPGFIDNVGRQVRDENRSTAYGGRAALLWKPSDAFKVQASALMQDTRSDSLAAVTLDTTTFKPVYGSYTLSTSRPDGYETRSQIYALDAEWNLGVATLDNTASYSKKSDVYTWDLSSLASLVPQLTHGAYPPELLGYRFDLALDKWTEELRLSSSSAQHVQWMIGFFYTREATRNYQLASAYTAAGVPITNYPDLLTALYPRTYRESAAFANVTYTITERFDISTGMRYASNDQSAQQITSGLFVGSLFSTPVSSGDSTTASFTSRYHLNPDAMVYVRVANGYRPGAPNSTYNNPAIPPSFAADKLVNYEIGFKGSLLDGRLILDDSLFYLDWTDTQVPQVTATDPALAYTGNTGSAVSRGMEVSATYRPTRNLDLGVMFAYTDAHLTTDVPTLNGKDGDPLPGSPKFGGSLTADYYLSSDNGWSWNFGGAYRYRGRINTGLRSSPASIEFPAAKRHVDLYWGAEWRDLTVRLYAKNLFAEQSYSGASVPFTTSGYVVDPPRTIGITLDARL
jgi:outer membrane receptor protein involved in Fe transport